MVYCFTVYDFLGQKLDQVRASREVELFEIRVDDGA